MLKQLQKDLWKRQGSKRVLLAHVAQNMDEFEKIPNEAPDLSNYGAGTTCENAIKKTGATARCIPFEQGKFPILCMLRGEAKHMVYWGKALIIIDYNRK